jgi:peptidyl-prolyl cis-trans isomerase C
VIRPAPPAAAALALVCACGLLAGCRGSSSGTAGTGTPETGKDRVLAEVAGEPIHESQVDTRLAEMPEMSRPEYSSPIGKQRLLEQMIEEDILCRAAVDDGLDREPAVAKRLESTRRQILSQAYLDRRHEIATQVPDEEARKFYDEHKDEYVTDKLLRVRILCNSSEKIVRRAREMVVDSGLPFATACGRFNENPLLVKARGLLPDWVRRGRAVAWLGNSPEFHEAVFGLEKGQLSDVFHTVHGYNIAMVEDVRDARQLSFEEARGDIVGRISRARSTKGLPDLMAELKQRYGVKVLETPTKSAEELFTEAQAAPDAHRKVELFQELVDRYPKDSRVLEALFMIGFTRAEELDDREGARQAFQRVIDEFPDSELAQSARWMLSSGGSKPPPFQDEGTQPRSDP